MVTVADACKLLDEMEASAKDNTCKDEAVIKKFAERIVELEESLVQLGVESDEQEMDTVELLCYYMKEEFHNVVKWLERECMDYSDWERHSKEED